MPRRILVPALFSLTLPTAAAAASTEAQPTRVTNAASRPADCAIVVDGKLRTYLKIRPGKTWGDSLDPRRTVQLVCERTVKDGVWRLTPGTTYSLREVAAGKLDLAEAPEATSAAPLR